MLTLATKQIHGAPWLDKLTRFPRRRPLLSYFVLAYALTWFSASLVSVSIALPLIGLFGPAIAALAVARISEGPEAVSGILKRLLVWKVEARWYIAVVALPVTAVIGSDLLHAAFGKPLSGSFGELSPLMALIGVLVVGEEIGWRGFALPRLLAAQNALTASVILGALWAVWHLPNFIFLRESSAYGHSFLAYCTWIIPFAILMTWIYLNTKGSLLIATLLHAAGNMAGPVLGGALAVEEAWLLQGGIMIVMVLTVIRANGADLTQEPTVSSTARGCRSHL